MIRVALLLLLVPAACARRVERPAVATPRAQAPAPSAPVRTDRSSYVLTNGPQGPEATIVATLHAPAGQALYIMNCNRASSATLQRKAGDAWEYAWLITMSACVSPPIVVPAGGEHTARIRVHQQSGRTLVPGTYRVVWTGVLTSFDANTPGYGPELPLDQRVSAPFAIHVPVE